MPNWLESFTSQLTPYHNDNDHYAQQDIRLSTFIKTTNTINHDPKVAIIGFPTDVGVKRNGGREGAATAPQIIRQCLYKLTPDPRCYTAFCNLLEHTIDLGDFNASENLEYDQEQFGLIIAACIKNNVIPIIIGGGHETGYAHFLGYALNNTPVNIINIDAHADVRPLTTAGSHSGSPFRQALEHSSNCALNYTVLGLQPQSNSKHYLQFLEHKNGAYYFADEVNEKIITDCINKQSNHSMGTLCMDALDQTLAPGVSAPTCGGLNLNLWFHAIEQMSHHPSFKSFDIVETNPNYDYDNQTTRLAAVSIWRILRGLAVR